MVLKNNFKKSCHVQEYHLYCNYCYHVKFIYGLYHQEIFNSKLFPDYNIAQPYPYSILPAVRYF